MAFVLDETGSFSEQFGHVFAMAGVTEKGFMNVKMEVDTPGGHSSVPPSHTAIGILSRMVVEFEEDPFMIHLVSAAWYSYRVSSDTRLEGTSNPYV